MSIYKEIIKNNPTYSNKTVKEVKKIVSDTLDSMFESDNKTRKFVAYTGCTTYGSILVNEYCTNNKCKNCIKRGKEFDKMMKEASNFNIV